MSVPKYHELMIPLLSEISSGKEYVLSDLSVVIAKNLKLSDSDLRELLPSGKQTVFSNRIAWAKTYLKMAGLITSPRRGSVVISKRGVEVLKSKVQKIDKNYLMQFEEFKAFQNIKSDKTDSVESTVVNADGDQTPQELLEYAHKRLKEELAQELLQKIQDGTPFFFEQLVIDLLINMGYGGNRKDAGEAFATTGDGGIDGTIKEDKLGLDVIYVQAKKWKEDSSVGRPEIQKFAGALQGVRAKKGVFITTSKFTKEARDYAASIDSKIILIDADKLAEYMIESNTGVSTVETYQIKKIDTDYFQED